MKKLGIIALAAVLVVAFTMPAAALESVWGGYWRTRFVNQTNFTGEDVTEAKDLQQVDTRTRLYYTAILNDNLKLVNKFEMNATWGSNTNTTNLKDGGDYGDVGADAATFLIKNSYADFKLGPVNVKMGVQGMKLARGFLYDNDFSGLVISYGADNFTIPFTWFRMDEGLAGPLKSEADVDTIAIAPVFTVADSMTLNPYFVYYMCDDWDSVEATSDDFGYYWLGFDFDASFDMGSAWFTAIYGGGETNTSGSSVDLSSFLVGGGASIKAGPVSIRPTVLYATGDDGTDPTEANDFRAPQNSPSYYWAEIMGLGIFDEQAPTNTWGDFISNAMIGGLGVTMKPMEKMSIAIDFWTAYLAEDDANGNDDIGNEVDFKLTYNLVEGLNMDVVFAYLFAGDALNNSTNQADPYEAGVRFSLSF